MKRALVLTLLVVAAIEGCASVDPWQDARIESEVKSRLVAQKSANLTRLGVVSKEATVYLSGTVESAEQRALAESVTRDVRGVRRVVNRVEVGEPTGPGSSARPGRP
jgi:hyperosmotically inducible periplasmic protein